MENISNKVKIGMIILIIIPILMLLLFLIGLSKVEAETYTYYFSSTPLHYYSGATYKTSKLPYGNQNGTYFYAGETGVGNFYWKNDVNLSFQNIDIVVFNITFKYTGTSNYLRPIRGINFMSMPCYYSDNGWAQENNFSYDSGTWVHEVSSICFIEKGMTISPNSNLVNLNTESVDLDQISISNMNIIDDDDLLQEIKTAIGTTNSRLLNINSNLSDINTILQRTELINIEIRNKVNDIYTAITNQTNSIVAAQNQTTTAVNDMANEDIDATSKQNVDETDYNAYKQKETSLMNTANQADMTAVNIGLNPTATSNIWTLVTRILNTNGAIMGLVISILSLGIIKLVLAR